MGAFKSMTLSRSSSCIKGESSDGSVDVLLDKDETIHTNIQPSELATRAEMEKGFAEYTLWLEKCRSETHCTKVLYPAAPAPARLAARTHHLHFGRQTIWTSTSVSCWTWSRLQTSTDVRSMGLPRHSSSTPLSG